MKHDPFANPSAIPTDDKSKYVLIHVEGDGASVSLMIGDELLNSKKGFLETMSLLMVAYARSNREDPVKLVTELTATVWTMNKNLPPIVIPS